MRTVERWSGYAIVLIAILLPFLVFGASQIPIGEADVHDWLPNNLPEKQRYTQFQQDFGNDQFLIVSWPGCRVDDSRLEIFKRHLLPDPRPEKHFIQSAQTTADVLEELTSDPIHLQLVAAKQRLRGILIGVDDTAACILRFTDHGLANQQASMQFIFGCADQVPDLGRDNLRMAGTLYEAYSVDAAAARSLKSLVIPSSMMGVLLAWICLRTIRGAIAVLLIAGIGQLTAVAIVYYSGGVFSAVLVVLPTLIFMLTLSGAVHLMNYYRDVTHWHANHWGTRAMLLGIKPTILASLTTSLGMASLALSQLTPVREFGLYSAFTLSIATTILLLVFPRVSDFFCRSQFPISIRSAEVGSLTDANPSTQPPHNSTRAPDHHPSVTTRYVAWMEKHAISVSFLGLCILGFSFYGLLFLKSSNKFAEMFPPGSPTVRDLQFIEEHLGPIASVEVLVQFPLEDPMDAFDQAVFVDDLMRYLQGREDIGAVMSATSFMPPLPKGRSLRDVTRRSLFRASLQKHASELTQQGWVAERPTYRAWRLTVKVSAMSRIDYGTLTTRVHQEVTSFLEKVRPNAKPRIAYTGLSPVVHETQQMLLRDLGASFTAAFFLITPVMMLIARNIWAGLLIMIPNVLPETIVFGSMAWLGLTLDIAGLLTASVAMGIAVNDTLHFVNWYSNRLRAGDTRPQAVAHTMSHCAVAMVHTMLISCCSMIPFLFADFIPTQRFACLMIAMIGSSILGDLFLLPALLLGPLGRCLRTHQPTNERSEE